MDQRRLGNSLLAAGGWVLAFGVMLLLLKLMMFLAWYYAGAVALAGLLLLVIGAILRS